MLDSHLHPRLKPLLNAVAGALDRPGISPDGLTLVGFAIGVLALPFLALGWYGAALAAILLNRLLDGFDGKLTTRRWASMANCSQDTALRDINELLERKVLQKSAASGRSTSYELMPSSARS